MIYLLHQLPVWLAGLIISATLVGGSILGIHLVGRYEPPEKRHDYNDIVGFVIAVVGVVHAVLLAWVAIIAWETYDKADVEVEREASYIGDIARVASGLPAHIGAKVRLEARNYAEKVVEAEWPEMSRGNRPTAAHPQLVSLQRTIVTFQPATGAEQNLHADLLDKMTSLFDARRSRVFQADRGISAVVWSVVLLGTVCLIGLSCFFGLEKQRHRIMTVSLALSTGLVLLMIETMDRPFLGRAGIAPDSFVYVLDMMKEEGGKV